MSEIKETKELVIGLMKLSGLLASHLKDGAQVADIAGIMAEVKSKPELELALVEAIKDVQKAKDEIKELSALEVVELIQAVISELPALVAALKK